MRSSIGQGQQRYFDDVPTPPGQRTFQLRITLQDIRPLIWRQLLVPGCIRLDKLHDIFQAAMGWTNSHLHSFQVGDTLYGMHFDENRTYGLKGGWGTGLALQAPRP